MAKVRTFSVRFPSYHPSKGLPTFFVEKFLNALNVDYISGHYLNKLLVLNSVNIANGKLSFEDIKSFFNSLEPNEGIKSHTIRSGSTFKAKDAFSPRIWFGKPYNSPQIIIWDDTEIKSVFGFEIKTAYKELPLDYDADIIINHRLYRTDDKIMKLVAQNDGLSLAELLQWFKYPAPFQGQLICWTDLKY